MIIVGVATVTDRTIGKSEYKIELYRDPILLSVSEARDLIAQMQSAIEQAEAMSPGDDQ